MVQAPLLCCEDELQHAIAQIDVLIKTRQLKLNFFGIFNEVPNWRGVIADGCSFTALCVDRGMNIFLGARSLPMSFSITHKIV